MKWNIREIEAGISNLELAHETDPRDRTPEQWALLKEEIQADHRAQEEKWAREAEQSRAEEAARQVTAWGTGPGLYNKDGTRYQGDDYSGETNAVAQTTTIRQTNVDSDNTGLLVFAGLVLGILLGIGALVLANMG